MPSRSIKTRDSKSFGSIRKTTHTHTHTRARTHAQEKKQQQKPICQTCYTRSTCWKDHTRHYSQLLQLPNLIHDICSTRYKQPLEFKAWRLAPLNKRNAAASVWPASAAFISGVLPSFAAQLTFIPSLKKRSMANTLPEWDAKCSAFQPLESTSWGSAPRDKKTVTGYL